MKPIKESKIELLQNLSFPGPEDDEFYSIPFQSELDEENYYEFLDEWDKNHLKNGRLYKNKILGYPDVLTEKIFDEESVLLLQMECETGRVYFGITKENLRKEKYSQTMVRFEEI